MLDELIDNIGLKYMENKLNNDVSLKNTLLIKVNKDNTLEHLFIEKKETMENLELKQWFVKRIFYSEYLNSNKAVVKSGVTSKLITSCVRQAVIFNLATLLIKSKKIKAINKEIFFLAIEEYIHKLESKINDSLILRNKEIIFSKIEEVIDKKVKIIILEDDEIENYKTEYNKYFLENIFDKDKNKKITKKYSGFITLNPDKPLLSNVGGITTEIQEYEADDVYKYFILNKYLDKFASIRNSLELESGEITFKYHPKDKEITDYEYIPYQKTSEYKLNIPIDNVLSDSINSNSMKNYMKLVDQFNKYTDFAFNAVSNDPNKDRLYYKYKNMIQHFWGKGEERQYLVDKYFIDENINKLLNDILIYKNHVDNDKKYKYLNVRETLNFIICVSDYFYDTNKKGDVLNMKEEMKEKIVNYTNNFSLNSIEQVAFMSGQLAKYLLDKSNTSSAQRKNVLISKYHGVKNWNVLKKYLSSDMKKYMYKCSSKEKIVYSEIILKVMKFKADKNVMTQNEKEWLHIGLYSDNIFYIKED